MKRVAIGISLLSACVSVSFFLLQHVSSNTVKDKVPAPVIQSVPTLDLAPLKAEIEALSQAIDEMHRSDEVNLSKLITQIKTELQEKLDTVHTSITSLEDKEQPIKLLPETKLPFHVLSIDSLQRLSIATVAYDHQTTALESGDHLAGWKVVSIDFATQTMVFANDEGEVHVHLGNPHA